ncbi:unnamed protein product [Caenorhabditis auriculariae]|uniref:Uncharacterized protein n=1 Tax=Caenorhabditis auriculariae TaxID=2777116 RepID=A0A8S1HUR5_9PELO|nr:unnamed protein product [Caenorhabditis auriculariae]
MSRFGKVCGEVPAHLKLVGVQTDRHKRLCVYRRRREYAKEVLCDVRKPVAEACVSNDLHNHLRQVFPRDCPTHLCRKEHGKDEILSGSISKKS